MEFNLKNVYSQLSTVIDPETGLDLVSMGLFYGVDIEDKAGSDATQEGKKTLKITMTLTSPGCPLIDVFDDMVRDSLRVFSDIDVYRDVKINLTFDPPWLPEMMSDEAKAELGID